MNEQLGEILNQLVNSNYKANITYCGRGISICKTNMSFACSNCPLATYRNHSQHSYAAQIGKTHHELRFSNSTGTDVQPEPRETSD
ncbi:MAG: hypothetical protein ACRDCE_10380 [Cetobacterium sp.]|uniref:hypothetical protein n=1 Tax=Cetobacterium sp. TaxID=2071632 RepID=UPI003EE703C9